MATPAVGRDRPAFVRKPAAGQVEGADQLQMQQSWDKYVAKQLSAGEGGASHAELVSTLEGELAQPGTLPHRLRKDMDIACCQHSYCLERCLSLQP